MTYTATQIENAKSAYEAWLTIGTVESYQPEFIGWARAEQECAFKNDIVERILNGNKGLEREWKMFFLREEVKAEQKSQARKAKLAANKDASADILAPVKAAKKLGEFGKWLNTRGNEFRSQHFSKKYTIDAVNAFMNTIAA